MQQVKEFLEFLNQYLGGSEWFVFLLLGTGLFFTFYLKFPQFRYFRFAVRIVKGKYDKDTDVGDASHFQALSTALSGTVGTGNIAGVALAIHIGGPAALFWMLVTALFGMTTKFVEVTISHKYRDILPDGSVSGGPMYYMKKRMNIRLKNGKVIKTGLWLGIFFALATILSSFGTGSLPQINSISNALFASFHIKQIVSGAVLTVLLALVIIGGIKRIAKVTSTLVPVMAIFYFVGALFVIATNYENIIPSLISIFSDVVTGTAAVGGFMGAGFAYAFNKGVNRGLFSNEAGQGSAPIAHSAARAHEPVSEGLVAILEPFIDTIIICTLTGLVLLASGAWHEKYPNQFQKADMVMLARVYNDKNPRDEQELFKMFNHQKTPPLFTGEVHVRNGRMTDSLTLVNAQSIAEEVEFTKDGKPFTGTVPVENGVVEIDKAGVTVTGKSLLHSAPLTTEAFKKSFLGDYGQYIVSIGLLLFAFSTAISWSYYGGRAMTFLFGPKSVIYYRFLYIIGFFFASFTDTSIVWALSYITIVLMALPNLTGLLVLHKEIKSTIKQYWIDFRKEHPGEWTPE